MPGSELAPAVNMVVSNSLWRNLFEQRQSVLSALRHPHARHFENGARDQLGVINRRFVANIT